MTGKSLIGYESVKQPKKPSGPKERFEALRNDPLRAYVRSLPCLACQVLKLEQRLPTEAAHVTTKGSGGGDDSNLYPACGTHHRWQHNVGVRSVEYALKRKLKPIARRIMAAFLTEQKQGLVVDRALSEERQEGKA